MRRQFGGFTKCTGWFLIIAADLLLTNSTAIAGKPAAPKPPAYRLIQLGQFPADSVSGSGGPFINDAGIVAGFCDERGAFVIVPADTDGDGRPDTWFRDQNQDGVNDLQVYIHLPTELSAPSTSACGVSGLNNAGQILGNFCYDTSAANPIWQGFVLTSRDVNADGRLEWFLDDGNGHNQLIATIPEPPLSSLNNEGQFVFGPFEGDTRTLLRPVDADADGVNEQYFLDANNDGLNDLAVALVLGSVRTPSNEVVPLLLSSPCFLSDSGQLIGRCWQELVEGQSTNWIYHGSFMITPKDFGAGELVWYEDSNSDGINDLAVSLPSLEAAMVPPTAWDQNPSGSAAVGEVQIHFMLQKYATWASRAVLWQVGDDAKVSILDLGCPFTVFTRPEIKAWAVNDKLQVVGSISELTRRNFRTPPFIPFLWQNGTMWDMNPVLGFSYSNRAWLGDINNNGVIVGEFMPTGDSSFRVRFVAVPVP